MQTSNEYLNQVVQEQAQVENELKRQRQGPVRALVAFKKGARGPEDEDEAPGGASPSRAVEYRITGFWRWKTVVVPPHVYVVHTRRGRPEPLHVGLGISFPYNPYTDAFLVIPAVVQTLLINARCICAERQGVLVQAYVQWIVDDVRTAYRKLDFSDSEDPMRIVNIQLREQAEAAIKDKVTTMSIEDVLSDKEPIIEELTHRLRTVAEGNREGDTTTGLGLKIVTVQIKEAVVSSTRLWENLQKPFRADREKVARLAELGAQEEITRQELTNRQQREAEELAVARRLAELRFEQEREQYNREQAERVRRLQVEQEEERRAIEGRTATERSRREAELELVLHEIGLARQRIAEELEAVKRETELDRVQAERDRVRATAAAEVEDVSHEARARREERDLGVLRLRRQLENDLSPQNVQAQLIARLPEVAASLPRPEELRTVSIGPDAGPAGTLAGFVASVLQLTEGLKKTETNGAAQVQQS
jgi:SPFH domain / Band 7 family